jgi:hypothetical protein
MKGLNTEPSKSVNFQLIYRVKLNQLTQVLDAHPIYFKKPKFEERITHPPEPELVCCLSSHI